MVDVTVHGRNSDGECRMELRRAPQDHPRFGTCILVTVFDASGHEVEMVFTHHDLKKAVLAVG